MLTIKCLKISNQSCLVGVNESKWKLCESILPVSLNILISWQHKVICKQGRKRPLDTPKRMIERREG